MAVFIKPSKESTRTWCDLDLDFTAHPVTKDIVFKKDVEAVKRSVRNLIRTNRYERPFQPHIDGGVTRHLFGLTSPQTKHDIESAIKMCISNYEPRAEVISVVVKTDFDKNGFNVDLTFKVVNVPDPVTVELFLERLR